MLWLLLFASVICMWIISLCKVIFFSRSPGKNGIFFSGQKQGERKRNALLIIAHPDDESMFFCPTLLFFTAAGHNVHVLCLSTGNADGKGDARKEEIFRACVILKVPPHNVTVLEDSHLQDGFCNMWDHQYVAQIVGEHIKQKDIDLVLHSISLLRHALIISFDNYGVSGHRNHCDVHHGTCKFLSQNPGRKIEAWELVSISIFRKYSGPLEIWLSTLFNVVLSDRERSCCVVNRHPQKSYLAMAEHDSQWVWFRKLFVLLSSYTYVNTLQRIGT